MSAYVNYIEAFIVGLVLAIPVGPMALLCVQRTLHFGLISGLVTGLGVAFADGIYAVIGILGLSAVQDFLLHYVQVLKIAGGAFLTFLGLRMFLVSKKIKKTGVTPENIDYWAAFMSACVLTLSNPMTILAYVAAMASIQLQSSDWKYAWFFVIPVFLGSFSWWLVLVLTSALFKSRLRDRHMRWIGSISGLLLIVFGFFIMMSVLV